MFRIEDGREHFYQWDLNRRVIVEDSSITQVHFCNKTDNCSLVVDVYEENGVYLADVPNILLQTDWKINVYGYDKEYTKHCNVFKVQNRTKPADYVYTETEVKNWEDLEERIKELENASGSDCYSKEETDELLSQKADANYVDEMAAAINDTYLLAEKKVDKEENKMLLEYVPIEEDYYVQWQRLNDDIYAPMGISVAFASDQANGVLKEICDPALVLHSYTDYENIAVITADGEIYHTRYVIDYEDDEKTGWTEWESPYVSNYTFNKTIGDIQSLLDSTISLADSYIGEVTE